MSCFRNAIESKAALSRDTCRVAVRVKGGMSLQNGMWHGSRDDIIMQNVKYGNARFIAAPFLAPI